jgi:hypothetical protein
MSVGRLVVNGCSYMEVYSSGHGHHHFAEQLSISDYKSLAIGGSANSRILRTTLKDSYNADVPTIYILGLTFISRSEIPILKYVNENEESSFEGRWTNPQNQMFSNRWENFWTEKDTDLFVSLKLKSELFSLLDRTEDLMYQTIALIDSLKSRGHKIIVFQQADDSYNYLLDTPRLSLFRNYKEIVRGFGWQAIQWQHQNGVKISGGSDFKNKYSEPSEEIKHRMPGEHQKLNEFLINYIKEYKILE